MEPRIQTLGDPTMSGFEVLLTRIKQTYDAIEPYEIYYGLRQAKVPRMMTPSHDMVQWCLAIQSQGYVITVDLLQALTQKHPSTITAMLHRLGDNNILTLVKDHGHRLRYIIHPRITQQLNPETIRQRTQLTDFTNFTSFTILDHSEK